MSDVDANGNVINTFLPSFSPRGNKNTTDIRRLIRQEPAGNSFGSVNVSLETNNLGTNESSAVYQTVADLTGVRTCTEGVEIVVHANTLTPPQFTMKGAVRISSGATGSYSESDRSGLSSFWEHSSL